MIERNKRLSEYFEKEYNKLVKKIARRAGSPENAEDIVQEAFFRATKYWDSYNPETDLGAWFNTIMMNAYRRYMNDDKMMGMSVEIEDEHFEPLDLDLTDHGVLKKVGELIRSKSYPQSEVLRLYYEKGYKPMEIKEILDMKHITVKMAILRFKEEVKEKLSG